MTIEFAKFTAEVAKGIKIGTEVEVKLLIPLKSAVPFLEFLSNCQGEDVLVHLGDPQASFDFDDGDPMYNTWNGGRRVTTDSSGVVTKIEGQGDEQKDENQAELFSGEGSSPDQQDDGEDSDKDALEQYILEHRPVVSGLELDVLPVIERRSKTGETLKQIAEDMDINLGLLAAQVAKYEFAVKDLMIAINKDFDPGNDSNGDNADIPDWMKEEGGEDSGTKEMDFSSDDGEGEQQPPADSQGAEGEKTNAPVEIDKEALEIFILNKRPIFDDIKLADAPADFPGLLEQRKVSGKTWLEISKEINIPSSQISSKYNAYKKRVTKMMQDGVAV